MTESVRTYGNRGPWVLTLHGGPGAPGYMAPVARGLAKGFRVVEPLQRRSGGEGLTVARHMTDLETTIRTHCPGELPAMVGSSWGAMLALAFGARFPDRVGPLVLVGCGTITPRTRAHMTVALEARLSPDTRSALQRLEIDEPDPDRRLSAMNDLLLPAYSCDLITDDLEIDSFDGVGFQQTWADWQELQAAGEYPAAFAAIQAPVLMLHGVQDPHPGELIRDSLLPALPQLEYHPLADCGHYPWLERQARDQFFSVLLAWLNEKCDPVE